MQIPFFKYQGTGNDFIIIDNRSSNFNFDQSVIAKICHRQFGIGADGLMFLNNSNANHFEMLYYNADGKESTMCGNGGRCMVAFAAKLGIVDKIVKFNAIDGIHEALVLGQKENTFTIKLKMQDINDISNINSSFFINTGSPHLVVFVKNIENFDVYNKGKILRNNKIEFSEGTNVDFIEEKDDSIFVRTYERGVENETLSCGTGVTAAALVVASQKPSNTKNNYYRIKTLGGELKVYFEKQNDNAFRNIWLEGPATFVFKGLIEI